MARKQKDSEYAGYRRAGIRLRENMVQALDPQSSQKLQYTLSAIHSFDKAHLVMLIEQRLVPAPDGALMLAALRDMENQGVLEVRQAVGGGAHSGEQYLIRKFGESVGGQLHLGRSSGDVGEVARRLVMRQHLLTLMSVLNKVRAVFLAAANEYIDAVMPGYTHGQFAQATTLGHWASMWAQVFSRDFDRCCDCYTRNNLSPAGAAIMTGTDFPLNRDRTAQLLGFDAPIPHTMDAVLSPDNTLEFAGLFALVATDQGRLADDIMLWSSAEFAFLLIPDRYCGTSSIMMHKKNPVWPEAAKAASGHALGALTETHFNAKGSTGLSLYELGNTDLPLFQVAAEVCARLTEGVDLIDNIEVDGRRMLDATADGWGAAPDLAGEIVRSQGVSWRSAHQIVGILVRWCEEAGSGSNSVTPSMLNAAAEEYFDRPVQLSESDIQTALNPSEMVARRTILGGPARPTHQTQLSAFQAKLQEDRSTSARLHSAAVQAEDELESAISGILGLNP